MNFTNAFLLSVLLVSAALAVAVLIDATIIRALIVPAVIALMGRWNWWLPESAAKMLRVEPSSGR